MKLIPSNVVQLLLFLAHMQSNLIKTRIVCRAAVVERYSGLVFPSRCLLPGMGTEQKLLAVSSWVKQPNLLSFGYRHSESHALGFYADGPGALVAASILLDFGQTECLISRKRNETDAMASSQLSVQCLENILASTKFTFVLKFAAPFDGAAVIQDILKGTKPRRQDTRGDLEVWEQLQAILLDSCEQLNGRNRGEFLQISLSFTAGGNSCRADSSEGDNDQQCSAASDDVKIKTPHRQAPGKKSVLGISPSEQAPRVLVTANGRAIGIIEECSALSRAFLRAILYTNDGTMSRTADSIATELEALLLLECHKKMQKKKRKGVKLEKRRILAPKGASQMKVAATSHAKQISIPRPKTNMTLIFRSLVVFVASFNAFRFGANYLTSHDCLQRRFMAS